MALTHLIIYHIYAWPKIANMEENRWGMRAKIIGLCLAFICYLRTKRE